MRYIFLSKPVNIIGKTILILAILLLNVGIGRTDTAHAAPPASQDNCGQLLADAEARFRSTLAPDGSVPATPENQAAAEEYIRISNLCYKEMTPQTSSATLQTDATTAIDDGGVLLGQANSAEFVLTGNKWGSTTQGTSGGTVTYSFMGNGISFSDEGYGSDVAITSLPNFKACFITDIQTAFAAWQAVSNIKFVQVTDSGSAFNASGASGDIRIGAHIFDGVSGTLAHAYFPPPNGASAAGDIHFDSQENWTCDTSGTDIGVVAMHEIGHSIGLNHENTGTVALMDPYYNPSLKGLQPDDINGATTIYGAAALSAPPGNDNFANATPVTSLPYGNNIDTTGATTETGEQGVAVSCNPDFVEDDHTLYLGHNTVWYKYSPSSSGPVSIDTLESNYDTYIAVWKGTALNNLALFACDDDNDAGQTSQLVFNATSGTDYYIQVAQYNGYYSNGTRTTATGGNLNFHISNIPGVGKYDDTDTNWVYTGSWTGYSGSDPYYSNTTHYTVTVGNSSSFAFTGTQFILSYAQAANRGTFGIFVDGAQITTINANGPLQYQKTYTSPVFTNGPHIVQFKFLGGAGPAMDVDAIQILNTVAPGVGKYDDTHPNWVYAGKWYGYSGSDPYYNNTTHYTLSVGNRASFTFTGTQFILSYAQATNRGSMGVYVDGTQITTINANGALQYQKTYTSPFFSSGSHEVELKFLGGAGPVMDIDAIQILNTVAPGVGKYDDTDTHWVYTGSWTGYSGSDPYYSNTTHYTLTTGNSASFTFNGTQFILSYAQAANRGTIGVYVDGSQVGTINANGALQFQKTYTSPVFLSGNHVAEFRFLGGAGLVMDVDAIEILNTAAPGVGKYDDTNANWAYAGAWTAYAGSDPYYSNTTHYTLTAGNSASFTFSGTQFILSYAQAANRGTYGVYVDGSQVGTINANGALQFQKTYTSPVFLSGTHVATFKYLGGAGPVMDVDAIEILNTAAPGVGKYDDTNANWAYAGAWYGYSGSEPYYNNTTHYTLTVGDSASFTFNGTQFILSYAQAANRGSIDVFVDGSQIATINANGPLQYQKNYTSPLLVSGTHLVQFKYAGWAGPVIDIDAIQIN